MFGGTFIEFGAAAVEALTFSIQLGVALIERLQALIQRRFASVESIDRSLQVVARSAHVGQDLFSFGLRLLPRFL